MPSSRNAYIFMVSTPIRTLLLDAHGLPGDFFSFSLGPITGYAKVIGCSLTTSNATTVIDGSNRAVNGTGELPEPSPHTWFTATPLPSRGSPHEDLFGTVATATSVTVDRHWNSTGPLQLSLLDDAITFAINDQSTLSFFEGAVRNGTALLYGAIGELYGYTSIPQPRKLSGWDPRPAFGVTVVDVVHARLKLVYPLTWIGLAFSIILFTTAMVAIGRCPAANVPLCRDRDLLFIISMLRRSTLTSALNNAVKDVEANDLDELRQFGKGLRVQVNEDGVLDVIHDEQGDQGDTKGPPKSVL
jgi:hypothetical protein